MKKLINIIEQILFQEDYPSYLAWKEEEERKNEAKLIKEYSEDRGCHRFGGSFEQWKRFRIESIILNWMICVILLTIIYLVYGLE
jgi:hypothetical protein